MTSPNVINQVGRAAVLVAIGLGSFHPNGYASAADEGFHAEVARAADRPVWTVVHLGLLVALAVIVGVLVDLVYRSGHEWAPAAAALVVVGGALALVAIGLEASFGSAGSSMAVIDVEQPIFGAASVVFWGCGFAAASLAVGGGRWRFVPWVAAPLAIAAGLKITADGRAVDWTFGLFSVAYGLNLAWLLWTLSTHRKELS